MTSVPVTDTRSLRGLLHALAQDNIFSEEQLTEARSTLIQKAPPPSISLSPEESIAFFDRLLVTASNSALPCRHLTLACDTLSAWLIRLRAFSPLAAALSNDRGDEPWQKLGCLILIHFENANQALSKALKDLLTNIFAAASAEEGRKLRALRSVAAESLASIAAGVCKKGGYYALDVTIRKGVGAQWVFQHYSRLVSSPYGAQKLVTELLSNLKDRNLCPSIGKALASLLTNARAEYLSDNRDEQEWFRLWEDPVMKALRGDLRDKVVTYPLPGIFKASTDSFVKFLTKLGLGDYSDSDSDNSHNGQKGLRTAQGVDELQLEILLCCLKVGKDMDMVGEIGAADEGIEASGLWCVALDQSFVASMLLHANPRIRVAALSLVCYSPSYTRPFSTTSLHLVKRTLPFLHCEPDPEIRDIIVSGIRNFIERLAASSYAAEKELNKLKRNTAATTERMRFLQSRVDITYDFCNWYIESLEPLLRPGTNYQLKITTLRILSALVRSGVDGTLAKNAFGVSKGHGSVTSSGKTIKKGQLQWPEFRKHVRIFRPAMKKALLNALSNPYGDIRALSAELLRIDPVWDVIGTTSFLERRISLMNESGREKDSDGVGKLLQLLHEISLRKEIELGDRMWGIEIPKKTAGLGVVTWILEILQEYITVAKNDFQRAVQERPIYGLFGALKNIFGLPFPISSLSMEEKRLWRQVQVSALEACREIWMLIKPPLCDQSPEGFVPMEIEDGEDDDFDSQTVMSYSWRAVKESTALLSTLFNIAPQWDDEVEPCATSLSRIYGELGGELLLDQLSELRHRGAFSAVSPAFVALSRLCFNSTDRIVQDLPKKWLEYNLQLIVHKSNTITRRSAGLPFLIIGILASEIAPSSPLLQSTFQRLMEIATLPIPQTKDGDRIELPQVHALNCLKVLFTDSRMSEATTPLIGDGLAIAVPCFGSKVWAIRNCGVMLFTALTTRLFGTKRSRNDYGLTAAVFTTKSFFARYPSLHSVLLRNLTEKLDSLEHDNLAVEMVYPSLSLVARLDADPSYDGMEDFRPILLQFMASRIWKVREMSARAFAALVAPTQCIQAIESLLSVGGKGENAVHGNLCAAKVLLERRVLQATPRHEEEDGRDVERQLCAVFTRHFERLVIANRHSVTKATTLQLITPWLSRLLNLTCKVGDEFTKLVYSYARTIKDILSDISSSSFVGRTLLKECAVSFHVTKFLHRRGDSDVQECALLCSSDDEELAQFSISFLVSLPALPSLPPQLTSHLWNVAASTASWPLIRASSLRLLCRIQHSPGLQHFDQLASILLSNPVEPILEAALPLLGKFHSDTCVGFTASYLPFFAHPSQPHPIRSAALSALDSLSPTLAKYLTNGPTNSKAPISLYVTSHNLLHDDDEEIRDLAARMAQKILQVPHPLLPQRSAELLLQSLPPSDEVATAIAEQILTDPPPGSDKALFMKEKENQWVDDVMVVEGWKGVLERCSGDGEYVQKFRAWVERMSGRVEMVRCREENLGEEEWVFVRRWELVRKVVSAWDVSKLEQGEGRGLSIE